MSNGSGSGLVRETEWRAIGARETAFDVLVTLDTNLQYQQNLAGRRIAILVLLARTNRLSHLSRHFPACLEALETIKPGDMVHVGPKEPGC